MTTRSELLVYGVDIIVQIEHKTIYELMIFILCSDNEKCRFVETRVFLCSNRDPTTELVPFQQY